MFAMSRAKARRQMEQILTFRHTARTSQISRYGHVGGAFGRPSWSRSLMNGASSVFFVGSGGFAISTAKMGG